MYDPLDDIGLEPVRCSKCGRFQGYASLIDGVVLILCKNCKSWNVVAEGETGSLLTGKDIYDMLPNRGQKV